MMVSVMNNDVDLDTKHGEVEKPRVSNEADSVENVVRDERLRDSNSNDEFRVSKVNDLGKGARVRVRGSVMQEEDGAQVLSETNYQVNGDLGLVTGEDFSGDGDMEIEFRDEGSRDGRDGGNSVSSYDGVSGDNVRVRSVIDNGGDMQTSVSSATGASSRNAVVRGGSKKLLGSGFEIGDMVWGKVKSHPWWPGHIFDEAFVSSSVRRTRKDGHVLVAFFGDSSYGWFDPMELIPYDHHYAEKSQQTTSRNFLRAVEESVDEASRRSALGLSCRCRNPYNFRPTNVPGYMAVDVIDYEPGAVYSVSQVQKARERFQPAQTLSFIKQFAATPKAGESKSIDFLKQKAAALAYRRSIFEEFDETYAQAFGQDPVRPSVQPKTDKEPSRAPLSGPLVLAETLGSRKSSTKTMKPKDLSNKKNKYLFKRRDEVGDLKAARVSQVHASSSSSSANEDGTSDSAAASYVLQKRDHASPANYDLGGSTTMDQVATFANHMSTKDVPPSGLGVTIGPDVSGKKLSLDSTISSLQSESSGAMKAPDSHSGLVKKKKKVVKRPPGERSSEKPDISEKRMKKLKKIDGERSLEHPERLSSVSSGHLLKPLGRPLQVREDSQMSNRKKEVEVTNSVPQQVGSASLEAIEENEIQLPQMLADLHGLALNPSHGSDRNRAAVARQFFLKFRSLVYLKASTALSVSESEPSEDRATKSSAAELNVSSLKPSKLSAKHDDPAKKGRKRLPSERQEAITAKKAKKITEVKSLSAEKRAMLKNTEMRPDGKAKVAVSQQPSSKPLKTEQIAKKMDRPPRVEEPTYLIMKFQAGSSLPSLVELKARFTRFGPLDTSLSRVFYTTNTCRVAFLYKQDANVAYRYAVGSKSLFSNVKFMLKPVAAPEPQNVNSGKAEDVHVDAPSNCDSSGVEPKSAVPATPLLQQQSVQQQLKSCLKKPAGGEEPTGPANGSSTVRTSRVRFNMVEEKGGVSNKEGVVVQLDSRNALSASEGGPSCSSSSSSVAMDVVINNQRFMSSLPLQTPPLPHPPPQFSRPPMNNPQHHIEVSPINNYNFNHTGGTDLAGVGTTLASPTQAPSPPNVDISEQMMSLLTKCQDVVINVKNILGYVPYHPL